MERPIDRLLPSNAAWASLWHGLSLSDGTSIDGTSTLEDSTDEGAAAMLSRDAAIARLKLRGFKTVAGVVSAPSAVLRTALETVPHAVVVRLHAAACAALRPPPATALQLWYATGAGGASVGHAPHAPLPTGLPSLDAALYGGLPRRGVTELVGPAGVGKTQLCSTLVATCGTAVAYIDTEKKFSAERLLAIAAARGASSEEQLTSLAERVRVLGARNSAELLRRVQELQRLVIDEGVGLVVCDSIAALSRADFNVGGGVGGPTSSRSALMARQDALGKVASALKHLSESTGTVVVVTNQVSRDENRAALGNTWAHNVNMRLALEWEAEAPRIEGAAGGGAAARNRLLRIVKSPLSAPITVPFTIGETGVTEVAAVDGEG